MSSRIDVAIVGAGPYGLSLASFLNEARIDYRIFGTAFGAWRFQMPHDMDLKSAGFASNIGDPSGTWTLGRFCAERGIPYGDDRHRIRLKDFCDYGLDFQQRHVPHLEDKRVRTAEQASGGFKIVLEDGEEILAGKLVVATGTTYFAHLPPVLQGLPPELVTHSSAHRTFDRFKGKEVAVLGRGASAVDTAASVYATGVSVQLFAREAVEFDQLPSEISSRWIEEIVRPRTAVGPGWRSAFMAKTPWAFRYLPANLRLEIVRRKLGPAAGCYVRERVEGKVPMLAPRDLQTAKVENGRLRLSFRGESGEITEHVVDHLIAGTGFRVDVKKIPYLSAKITETVKTLNGSPVLTGGFESSVPGLFFMGLPAAVTFGPLLRFVAGTEFAARTVSRRLEAVVTGRKQSAIARKPALETVESK